MKKNSIFRMGVALFLLLTGMSLRAYAADDGRSNPPQKNYDVDLTVKAATVQTFTDAFTRQTDVLFSYESALASMPLGDMQVREKQAPLERILDNVFTKRGFRYKIVDRTVVLTYDKNAVQEKKEIVTGRVTDEAGQPMIGATVRVKDTMRGTTTGADGGFSIEAAPGSVLVFSFIGYLEREEALGKRIFINVSLEEDQALLEEVVVVGYGTQTRKTVTSAISKVDGKTLESLPVNSVGDGLKGRVAGVRVATTDAQPGADPKFLIRGGSSINNSNDPIIMVDGVQREMTGLNPNDIESIEVLKDAASAGIYGSRASNGVVLITTKKGSAHKGPQIVFEGQWAYENAATKFDLMNAKDYLLTLRPAIAEGYCGGTDPRTILDGAESAGAGNNAKSRWTTRYLNPGESLPKGYQWIEDPVNPGKIIIFQDNDQQSQWFDDAFWQNYYVGVNGGSESIKYAASAGYTDDGGVGIATGFSRFTFHGNTSFKVTKRLTASTTFDYSQIEMQQLNGGSLSKRNSVIRGLSVPNTHRDWYDSEAGEELVGTPAMGPNNTTLPAAYYNYYYSDTGETIKRASVNINLEWEIIDGLRAVGQFSNHNRHTRSHFFVKNNPTTGTNIRPTKEGFSETNRMDFQTYLNYKKTFGGDHNIDILGGYDYMKDKVNSFDARVQGAPSDKIPTLDVGTSNITNYPRSTRTEEVLISYFGRANYNYKEKYLLSFTMRADGSSKFASGNRWGYFPAGSAGWIVNEEGFWPENKVVSSLKLRASYGLTGNNGIGLYDTYGSYTSLYQYNGNSTIITGDMPNNSLTWESTSQFNVGLDLGFANDRVRMNIDYYNKVTKNLLFDVALPNTTGYASVMTNVGKVRFYGLDLAVSSVNISKRDFTWTTDFTYNFNMNKVLKLPDNGNVRNRINGITIGDGSQYGGIAEGERMGRIYGYRVDHIIESQADADAAMYDASSRGYRRSDRKQVAGRKDVGDYEWVNRAGSTQMDGRDIINEEDQFLLGYATPHSTGGIGNTFRYKGWTLNIYMDYALGHSIQNDMQMRYFMATMGNCNYNLVNDVKNCWSQPGDNTKYARFTANDADWGNRNFSRTSNVFVEKGDYLCIRDISLSYSLPKRWTSKLGMKDVTLTVSGNTLYYWTAVHGVSPEAATTGGLYSGASTYDTAYNPYPPTRKILFSAKFTF
ncbi:TonB-dependent receptor [uncultured Alistipes sp.]|uniref:SusC/RagA family TonB-linked outer membrane protein n=1 Tax=uncultured Alistipes sp. TaxID=538949 RepID=UPI0025D56510|nr:TonB-dependent receptor [uncultured Alistipes sp.]